MLKTTQKNKHFFFLFIQTCDLMDGWVNKIKNEQKEEKVLKILLKKKKSKLTLEILSDIILEKNVSFIVCMLTKCVHSIQCIGRVMAVSGLI